MTARSFRDRYAALAGGAPRAEPSESRATWPIPRGARERTTVDGACVVHDSFYSGPEVERAIAQFIECVRCSDRYVHPNELLFLDTETTGLHGGTGTHVFLIGLGRFSGNAFH